MRAGPKFGLDLAHSVAADAPAAFDFAEVENLCGQARLLVVHDTLDSSKANLTMNAFWASRLLGNSLHCPMPCAVHIVHALEFVARIPANHNALVGNLRRWFALQLLVVDHGQVSEENSRHLERVLEYV